MCSMLILGHYTPFPVTKNPNPLVIYQKFLKPVAALLFQKTLKPPLKVKVMALLLWMKKVSYSNSSGFPHVKVC